MAEGTIYRVTGEAPLLIGAPAGIEYKAAHMAGWAQARESHKRHPATLSVHPGDLLRASTPEAAAALADLERESAVEAVKSDE